MTTQLIELKKPLGKHKVGDRIKATRAQIQAAGLKPEDYIPRGTYTVPVASDLAQETTKAK